MTPASREATQPASLKKPIKRQMVSQPGGMPK